MEDGPYVPQPDYNLGFLNRTSGSGSGSWARMPIPSRHLAQPTPTSSPVPSHGPGPATDPDAEASDGGGPKVVYRFPWQPSYEDRYPPPNQDVNKQSEFDRRYPPDRYGEEATDNSRVWRVYRDRATEADQDLINGWNRTLDILLIFAGLFSAVSTAFIIEAYQLLQPDYAEYTAKALFVSITLQRNASAGVDLLVDPGKFSASRSARWVNGLWFSTLALTLFVGLLAILAKQWLGEYESRMRAHVASHRRWVWRHLVYNAGLHSWRIDVFISTLPFLLHISLFLFISGLVVFLTSLDWIIAGVILGLSAVIVAIYIGAMFAPLWYGNCPTATPILRQARSFLFAALKGLSTTRIGHRLEAGSFWSKHPAYSEEVLMAGHSLRRDTMALKWMISTLPAVEEVDVAVDAIGSLNILQRQREFSPGNITDLADSLSVRQRAISRLHALAAAGGTVDSAALGRCLRSLLFLDVKARDDDVRGPMITRALERWPSIKTHDIYMLSVGFNPSDAALSEVIEVIAEWSLKSPQSLDGIVAPCLPSTMALLVGRRGEYTRVATDGQSLSPWPLQPSSIWSGHQLPFLFCYALNYFVAGGPEDFGQGHTTFELLTRAVLRSILGSREAQLFFEQQKWPTIIDQDSMRLCGLLVLGHIIQTSAETQADRLQKLAIDMYASTLAELRFWSDPLQRVESGDTENCLWYIGTPDFVRHTWEPDCLVAATHLLLSACRPGHWSAALGDITRNVAAKLALDQKNEDLAREGARLLAGLLQPLPNNRARTARRIAIHGSTEDALRNSRLNLLQSSTNAEVHSVWRSAWTLRWPERGIMLRLADDLVQHLIYLHRNGIDVSAQLQELLRDGHNLHLALMATGQDLLFFVNIREMSPSRWDETSQELAGLPNDSWISSGFGIPDAATFVRLVNEYEARPSYRDGGRSDMP